MFLFLSYHDYPVETGVLLPNAAAFCQARKMTQAEFVFPVNSGSIRADNVEQI